MPTKLTHAVIAATGSLWLVAVAYGWSTISRYNATPGESKHASPAWPSDSPVSRSTASQTLLVFVHPKCPCTTATVSELSRLLVNDNLHTRLVALAYTPSESDSHWLESPTMSALRMIPGLAIIEDRDGMEAQRFSVKTSGEMLLYDRDGRLRYQGGVTGARGHEGGNAAEQALVSRMRNLELPPAYMPAFGCSLVSSQA